MSAVAIVDNGGANIASLQFALGRLGVESRLTADAAELRAAARDRGRCSIRRHVAPADPRSRDDPVARAAGSVLSRHATVVSRKRGSRVRCRDGLPRRDRRARVRRMMTARSDLPVPHIGWNRLDLAATLRCCAASKTARTCTRAALRRPRPGQSRPAATASGFGGRAAPELPALSFIPSARRPGQSTLANFLSLH